MKLRRESFGPYWRDIVKSYQQSIQQQHLEDPAASNLAALLMDKQREIAYLVQRAQQLGAILEAQSPQLVLCHADIHAGNVLVDDHGQLFIVDWDETMLAPKERDLMFIGGGVGGVWNQAEEEAWFWEGYGQTAIHRIALAYYRHERIVQDIAVTILETRSGRQSDDHREIMLRQVEDQFLPGNVVEIALRTAPSL